MDTAVGRGCGGHTGAGGRQGASEELRLPALAVRAVDELCGLDPSVQVREDERWVDDGDLVTSARVSAGIDMALHLVARLAGPERERQVRRGIQYDPAPPV